MQGKLVAYFSEKLNRHILNYSMYGKELYAEFPNYSNN
jgi:hypothetical protein